MVSLKRGGAPGAGSSQRVRGFGALSGYDGSVPLDAGKVLPASAAPMLRVCSYNLLAQSLLEANSALYSQSPADALHGPSRLARLGGVLSCMNADVLALQEVERPTFEWLSAHLETHGMTGVYKKRTGDQQDGVAIFVRSTRLQVVTVEEVEYRDLADAPIDCVHPPPAEDTVFGLRLQEHARKDNVALLVLASDRMTGANVLLGCTHILWNPKRYTDIDLYIYTYTY